MDRRLHLFLSGRVQGVLFRQSAKEYADERGIRGWIRNAPDGSVEIIVEGQAETLERFLVWAKEGPEFAEVTRVRSEWSEPTGEFDGFEVR